MAVIQSSVAAMADGPNGQIILFSDSITKNAFDSEFCFSYAAALSHGTQVHPNNFLHRLCVYGWKSRPAAEVDLF